MICIWSSWCHCHPIISCSRKIQNGLPFWCRLTQVVLETRPLYGRSSSSSSSRGAQFCLYVSTMMQLCLFGHHGIPPFPSNRHHRSSGDCLEGKRENYQVCSVQYCVQQLYAMNCTHIWTDLTVLWIGSLILRTTTSFSASTLSVGSFEP